MLGRTNMFRFNHPKEAAKLREKRKVREEAYRVREVRVTSSLAVTTFRVPSERPALLAQPVHDGSVQVL